MADEFTPAELKRHLETCTECHDPNKDGGDAIYCEEAQLLFQIFRTLLRSHTSSILVSN